VNGARAVAPNSSIAWNAVSDSDGYRLSVGTEVGGTDFIINQDVGLLTEFSFSEILPATTMIYVTIAPYNSVGENLNCASQSFETASTSNTYVPFCTGVFEPIDGQSNVQTSTTISWNEVANADGYFLTLGSSSGENDILDSADVGLNTSYFVEDLPIGALIYVQVKPYNTQGSPEACPESAFITTFEQPETDDTLYGFSPNGDGLNDFWVIDGIENHPENIVTIYNRWGDPVYKTSGYDNFQNVFFGEANLMTKIGGGKLPEGTYFFTININGTHALKRTKGYVVLKR
jgi:gliding motility-associated-like protein